MKNRILTKSQQLWKRACEVIPAGTQTLSKGPDQFVRGVYPIYLKRGKGCHVWDVDGNRYIDYPMALGPIVLGYNYPSVDAAIRKQLKDGITFTLMHPLEVELAELLTEIIPCAQMVRFGKNGVDATSAAVRVARAHTQREKIAFCGYHGYQDWFAITTSRNNGIPRVLKDYIFEFTYNDIGSLERVLTEHPGEIACVIMEQPGEEPRDNFLQRVIDATHKHGALYILDEIATGFRYALGGVQEYYKIVPDLACYGKAMGNGMPISCVVGKKEYMKRFEEVFFSTTFGGETLSLAASCATLREMRTKDVASHLWKMGLKWKNGFNCLARSIGVNAQVGGAGPRTHFIFKDNEGRDSMALKSLFMQETVKRGILFGGPIFMTYSHTDREIDMTLTASERALKIAKKALDEGDIDKYMEGEKITEVFRVRR